MHVFVLAAQNSVECGTLEQAHNLKAILNLAENEVL